MQVDWTTLKGLIQAGKLPYRYFDLGELYFVCAVDQPFQFECYLNKDSGSDQTDFESNFKAAAFSTISQFDSDGAQIMRPKAAKSGWTYASIPVEVTTSKVGGLLYSKLSDGTDRGWATVKTFDANGNEITTSGLLNVNEANITTTQIDFEPSCDYEIIGGELRTTADTTQDLRLWIIAVPDIPANQGGSKEMVGGINLNFLPPNNAYSIDGRVSKSLKYNATYHTSKLRLILQYPAGYQSKLSVVFEMYRP